MIGPRSATPTAASSASLISTVGTSASPAAARQMAAVAALGIDAVVGDADRTATRAMPLGAADPGDVSFCTRLHFGRPQPGEDRFYARFAYSGLPVHAIEEGLGLLKEWIEA